LAGRHCGFESRRAAADHEHVDVGWVAHGCISSVIYVLEVCFPIV
jgi:hypothetical protein